MTDYVALLKEKMEKEYDEFIEKLRQMPVDKVIDSSYEKVVKEDLVCCFDYLDLDNDAAKVLHSKSHPLDLIYQEWMKSDTLDLEMLNENIDFAVEAALKHSKMHTKDAR